MYDYLIVIAAMVYRRFALVSAAPQLNDKDLRIIIRSSRIYKHFEIRSRTTQFMSAAM